MRITAVLYMLVALLNFSKAIEVEPVELRAYYKPKTYTYTYSSYKPASTYTYTYTKPKVYYSGGYSGSYNSYQNSHRYNKPLAWYKCKYMLKQAYNYYMCRCK